MSQVHADHRRIVWPLAVAETLVWAAFFYVFPALILHWERDPGWNKAELTGAFTLALLTSALCSPLTGRLIDRGFGLQVLTGGALLGALMLVALSQVQQLWQFYLVWVGLGVAISCSLYDACFAVLTRLLGEGARRAITLVTLVAGFAGTVSFPAANLLAAWIGWRAALLVFALVVALVAVPLFVVGCRRGDGHGRAHAPHSSHRFADALTVLRRPVFWLVTLALTLTAVDHGMLLTHLLPILDERGVRPGAAVLAAAMIGPMQVVGRIAIMLLGARLTIHAVAASCHIAMSLAALALLGAAAIPLLLAAFVLLQGAGMGVTSIVRPVLAAEFFGRGNFGVVAGMMAAVYLCGLAAAPTVGSLVWQLGGYDAVIALALVAALCGLGALTLAARMHRG